MVVVVVVEADFSVKLCTQAEQKVMAFLCFIFDSQMVDMSKQGWEVGWVSFWLKTSLF